MTEVCIDEYNSDYPEDIETDVNAKYAFSQGFKSFKSDAVDYLLEHHDQYPVTIVLFYDSGTQDEAITRNLTCKLLDVFVLNHEERLKKAQDSENNSINICSTKSIKKYEGTLPVIYEAVSRKEH